MSSYVQGLLTGGVLVFSALIFMGQQDLELAEQRANNRFDEIVKALEIVYDQIDSTSENNFVKMNDLEKKIDHTTQALQHMKRANKYDKSISSKHQPSLSVIRLILRAAENPRHSSHKHATLS